MSEPKYLVGEWLLKELVEAAGSSDRPMVVEAQAILDAGPVTQAYWTKEQCSIIQHDAREMCKKLGIPITANSTELKPLDMSDEAMRESFEKWIKLYPALKQECYLKPYDVLLAAWQAAYQYLRDQMKARGL